MQDTSSPGDQLPGLLGRCIAPRPVEAFDTFALIPQDRTNPPGCFIDVASLVLGSIGGFMHGPVPLARQDRGS